MTPEILTILQGLMVNKPNIAPPSLAPNAPPSFEEEMAKPMPQFNYQPQQQAGGIRGLLAMIASGIGHGAGAQGGVGGGLTAAYEGNMQDAEKRRQLDYQRQAQKFKNVYDAEADKRANLVRIVQQKRADADVARKAAHEGRMESIAGDRAQFDMAKAGQGMIEKGEDRAALDARDAANRASREKLAANLLASLEKREGMRGATSRANAQARSGAKGEITPLVAVNQVKDLEAKLAAVNAQIATHKNKRFLAKGKNQGKLMNPPDSQGNNSEINSLWNTQKKYKAEIGQWRNWMARFGQGVPPPGQEEIPQQDPQHDPILSLFSDILQ